MLAGRHIDEDPELAHRHALSAARRAGRIAVVRETLAITAYATGDYALALRELRTYRRISGSNEQLPLMVDSERGLERPDRALELGRSVDRETLTVPTRVELAIAMSGARLDQEQPDLALAELEIPQLDPERAYSWSPALFGAYATVLEELGRDADAERWVALAERAARALQDEVGDETIEIIDVQIDDDEAALLDDETGVRIEDEAETAGEEADDEGRTDEADGSVEVFEDTDGSGAAVEQPDESADVVASAVAHADPSPLSFEDDVRAEVEQLLAEDKQPDALDALVAAAIGGSASAASADASDAAEDAPVADEAPVQKKRAAKKAAEPAAEPAAEEAPEPKQRAKRKAAPKPTEEGESDAVVESEQQGD